MTGWNISTNKHSPVKKCPFSIETVTTNTFVCEEWYGNDKPLPLVKMCFPETDYLILETVDAAK